MDKIYKEYSDIRAQLEQLEALEKNLKEVIIGSLNEQGLSKKETKFGTFTLGHRSNWTYSDKVKLLEAKVKIAKDREQKKGTAVESVTEFITYKKPKA